MKKVGFADINTKKWAIPAGILTFSFVSVIAAGAGPANSKTTVTKVDSSNNAPSSTESPAPDASPEITINGVNIPTDSPGRHEVTIPGGNAQVQVSDGQTSVTANTSSTPGETANVSTGNVEIHIDAHSSSVNSTNRSASSSSSYSTSVFSNGKTDVNVSR